MLYSCDNAVVNLIEHVLPPTMFEKMDTHEVRDEVRNLLGTRYSDENLSLPTDRFYSKVVGADKPVHKSILPYLLLCCPNSNSGTERLFTLLKAVHANTRLDLDTINKILAIKLTPIYELDITPETIKKCKSSTMLYNREHQK